MCSLVEACPALVVFMLSRPNQMISLVYMFASAENKGVQFGARRERCGCVGGEFRLLFLKASPLSARYAP